MRDWTLARIVWVGDRGFTCADNRRALRAVISTKPGLNRYLPVTPGGSCTLTPRSRPNRSWTASTCCAPPTPAMSTQDIALGYKQLFEVERGWRTLKTTLDLRPVYHRLEDRIRAHVILCWLALLLVRTGTYRQRTELTKPQRDISPASTSPHTPLSSANPIA